MHVCPALQMLVAAILKVLPMEILTRDCWFPFSLFHSGMLTVSASSFTYMHHGKKIGLCKGHLYPVAIAWSSGKGKMGGGFEILVA